MKRYGRTRKRENKGIKKQNAKKAETSSKNTKIIAKYINIILLQILYTNKNNNNAGPNGKSKKKMRRSTRNAQSERDGPQHNKA